MRRLICCNERHRITPVFWVVYIAWLLGAPGPAVAAAGSELMEEIIVRGELRNLASVESRDVMLLNEVC